MHAADLLYIVEPWVHAADADMRLWEKSCAETALMDMPARFIDRLAGNLGPYIKESCTDLCEPDCLSRFLPKNLDKTSDCGLYLQD